MKIKDTIKQLLTVQVSCSNFLRRLLHVYHAQWILLVVATMFSPMIFFATFICIDRSSGGHVWGVKTESHVARRH